MEIGAVLLLLALLLAVGMFVAAPLLGGGPRRAQRAPHESSEISSLMAERDRAISSLQELDFDFSLGKIPEDDYPAQRSALVQRGAEILRRLDELAPATSTPAGTDGDGAARIEHAVAEGSSLSASAAILPDEKIESMLAARRAARRAKSAGFCPRCGKPVLTTDQFCPNCGKALG